MINLFNDGYTGVFIVYDILDVNIKQMKICKDGITHTLEVELQSHLSCIKHLSLQYEP